MGFWFGWLGDPRIHMVLIVLAFATLQPAARSAYLALGHSINRFERIAWSQQAIARYQTQHFWIESNVGDVADTRISKSSVQP